MKSLTARALMPYGSCYAIEPQAADSILRTMAAVDMAAHLRSFRADAQDAPQSPAKPYVMAGSVARLPLAGPLTKELSSMADLLGGTSTAAFSDALRQAVADPDVRAVLIDIDSPGGTVSGTDACAEAVRQAAGKKPVYAHAADLCCSAAYWIGAQASALYAAPGAVVGSIGVVSVIYDTSKAAESDGVTAHVISSGPYKGAGADGAPVSAEHLAEFQRVIDDSASQFVSAVAKGRRLPVAEARDMADGRVHIAGNAPAGMIDGVLRADALLKKIQADPKAALPARDTHPNARMGNDNAKHAHAGQEKPIMRSAIASALARMGMTTFAASVLGAQDDEPETVAASVAANAKSHIDAEASARVAAHPMLSALATAEINTPEALAAVLADAKLGRDATNAVRATAKQDAIVAFGAEQGATYAATIDALPAGDALNGYAAHLSAEAAKIVPPEGGTAQTKPTENQGVTYAQVPGAPDAEAEAVKRTAALLAATPLGKRALADSRK